MGLHDIVGIERLGNSPTGTLHTAQLARIFQIFQGMKSCSIFLLLFGVFQQVEIKSQISPVPLYLNLLEHRNIFKQEHSKNLTKRDGRIQGRHKKGSSQQKVLVGQRRQYRQPLRRQGTFYEKWP